MSIFNFRYLFCFFAGVSVFCSSSMLATTNTEQKSECSIVALKNQFANADERRNLDRLHFFLCSRSGNIKGAKILYKTMNDQIENPINYAVHFESSLIESVNPNRKIIGDLWDGLNWKSPCHLTRLIDETEKLSQGSFRVSGYLEALALEPYWVPALYGRFKIHRGSWGHAANEGATLLELSPINSLFAKKIISNLPEGHHNSSGELFSEQTNQLVKAYHIWLKENKVWSKYNAGEDRLTAVLFYHGGKSADALQLYQKMSKEDRHTASSFYRFARIFEEEGQQEDADKTIKVALEKIPQNNSILLVLAAKFDINKGDMNNAEKLLKQCLINSPEYPPAHILLAEIGAKQGNHNSAIEACANAAAYSYGWPDDILKRIHVVIDSLVHKVK